MPQDALDSSALQVTFTVQDGNILQKAIRELFDTLVGYTSTEVEDWRVVRVDETATDGSVVVDFVYREGSECLSAYADIWPFMTGSGLSHVDASEPKEDLRQAAATSGQNILTLSLTIPEACDVPMVEPPPPPRAPATQTQAFTPGQQFTVELLLGSGSTVAGLPDQFIAIKEDTASFIIPQKYMQQNGNMLTLKVSNGETEYDLLLKSAGYEPFVGKYLTFDGDLSFEQRLQLAQTIPFVLVDSSEEGVSFGLPSDSCADLMAEYDFIEGRSAKVAGQAGSVDCKLKKKMLKKFVSLKGGEIISIELPSSDMRIVDPVSLDPKLILVDNKIAKILLPQRNLDLIDEDSLRILFANEQNEDFEVVLDLSEARENRNNEEPFEINFKFKTIPADRWGLRETLTALKQIRRAGVPDSVKLIEVTANLLVLTDPHASNSECSFLEEQYDFIENGELYFPNKYFKDDWKISTVDSVICDAPTPATTTKTTTTTKSEPICILDAINLQKKLTFEVEENVQKKFSKEDLLVNVDPMYLDQVDISAKKVDPNISNWNSQIQELTVFPTWDAIVKMKAASGMEGKKASDISFAVSAANCETQVIKVEFSVDFVNDCPKPSHLLGIELILRTHKPMLTDKFNVMEIIRDTYNDEDMEFIRVKNFTKIDDGTIFIEWMNHTEVICQTESCPTDEIQELINYIVDQSNPQKATAKQQFINFFKGTDYTLKRIASLQVNVCGDGNQIPPPKTPQTGEVEGPASAGTSVILLIIGTIALVTAAIGCIYMKKKKENQANNNSGNVEKIQNNNNTVTIMDADLDSREGNNNVGEDTKLIGKQVDSKTEGEY
ncbi:unnamed protein product [Oikopleura dioica]|uniref:Peptidase S72 domain-containing protein n=2 Tax=Oikopleura dioica TaxID=34765 RepID=E4YL62_OIKDI|nr:unnamed protein product [Oikopleura dioica]